MLSAWRLQRVARSALDTKSALTAIMAVGAECFKNQESGWKSGDQRKACHLNRLDATWAAENAAAGLALIGGVAKSLGDPSLLAQRVHAILAWRSHPPWRAIKNQKWIFRDVARAPHAIYSSARASGRPIAGREQ